MARQQLKKFSQAKKHKSDLSQKQVASVVSPALYQGNQFKEIINLCADKKDLNTSDQYLYGYALFRQKQPLEALVVLWPLAQQGNQALKEDCRLLAQCVFQNRQLFESLSLSAQVLATLFSAANRLTPESPCLPVIQNKLLEALWLEGDYDSVERILKSSKAAFSGTLLENLGKLSFYQSVNKLSGDPIAKASYLLTSAACFILRHPMYHADILSILQLFSEEIEHLLLHRVQSLAKYQTVLVKHLAQETSLLAQVLALAIKDPALTLDIIPTPGYLNYFDATTNRVGEKFLAWLQASDQNLNQQYQAALASKTLKKDSNPHTMPCHSCHRLPVLSQANPFEQLGVSPEMSKKAILNKVMCLSQQSPKNMSFYRQAQNELFTPAKRFLHHYLRYFSKVDREGGVQTNTLSDLASLSLDLRLHRELLHV